MIYIRSFVWWLQDRYQDFVELIHDKLKGWR